MEIRNYEFTDLEEVIKLAKLSYKEEKDRLNYLKPINDYSKFINDMFYKRFGKNSFGKVLLIDNSLVGYLVGVEID